MVYPAFRVRPMFPLKAAYFCPLLPQVDGFPILRVLRVDLTPSGFRMGFALAKSIRPSCLGNPEGLSSS